MKKYILQIIILLFLMQVSVFASDEVVLSIGTANGCPGDIVSIDITISANTNICGGSVCLKYDSSKLKAVSGTATPILNNYSTMVNAEYKPDCMKFSWAGAQELTEGGKIFVASFQVLENVSGNANLSVENLRFADVNADLVKSKFENGIVTIEEKKETNSSSGRKSPSRTNTIISDLSQKNLIFSDVSENDWFYEAVKFAFEKKITSGVTDNMFAPNDNVTRGQFIAMLCRAYVISEMKGDNFADAGDTWYTGYLAAAKQLKISNGVGDNKFAPEKEITREEMVTLIYNYLKSVVKVTEETDTIDFADKDKISDWAKTAVSFAAKNGIVKGKDNNMFAPNDTATRAELVQIFYNMLMKR